jgi:Ulp1 family protease
MATKTTTFYDSLRRDDDQHYERIFVKINEFLGNCARALDVHFITEDRKFAVSQTCPQQLEGLNDCGVYCIEFASPSLKEMQSSSS